MKAMSSLDCEKVQEVFSGDISDFKITDITVHGDTVGIYLEEGEKSENPFLRISGTRELSVVSQTEFAEAVTSAYGSDGWPNDGETLQSLVDSIADCLGREVEHTLDEANSDTIELIYDLK